MCNGDLKCDKCNLKSRQVAPTFDTIDISTRKFTDEGFLIVSARLARPGIQQYKAFEIGYPADDPNEIVKVYRPPSEVFDPESIASFEGKPVTNEHPPELVSVDNIKNYQVGYVSKNIDSDEDGLIAELVITDKDAISNIENGKVEVSNGYTSTYDFTAGNDGDISYDAVQKNIRGNHIAIVSRGRCGPECRIFDSEDYISKGDKMMSEASKKFIKINDSDMLEVPAGSEVIVKELQDQLAAMKDRLLQKDKELFEVTEKMTAQNDELLNMRKERDEMGANKLDEKELDEKIDVIDTAKAIVDPNFSYQGKSVVDIKREIIAARSSGITLDSKSDEYISARYDIIKEDLAKSGSDVLSRVVGDSLQVDNQISPRDEMIERNKNLWRNK